MKRSWLGSFALALGLTLLMFTSASAHERRTVGKYEFVVGFLNEPAYVNQPNAIDLRVTNKDTGKPVEGLEKTVNAEVLVGGKTLAVPLRARFGQPGAYAGDFVPTRTGAFLFRFSGDIEGFKFDEKFESGPGRFNDVQDTAALQFPEKILSPSDIAANIKAAQDAASTAQMFGLIGIAVGVVGAVVGALGFTKRK